MRKKMTEALTNYRKETRTKTLHILNIGNKWNEKFFLLLRVNLKYEVSQCVNKNSKLNMECETLKRIKYFRCKVSESKKVTYVKDTLADSLFLSECILVFIRRKMHKPVSIWCNECSTRSKNGRQTFWLIA